MELRHLRYFLAVAEEGHITAAAERLGIQQPPLSRIIKAIERDIDAQLFIRNARGVELTEAGRAFAEGARTVLANLDQALDRTRSTSRGERGRLCIGFTATSAFNPLVARAVREFRTRYPLVQITCEEHMSAQLIERLRSGQLDAAFLWSPPTEGIVVNPLMEDRLVVAMPADHPLSANTKEGQAISISALADENFVIYGRRDGFGLYAATIMACRAAGFTPRFVQEAPRLSAALSLVAIGLGVFFVPSAISNVYMHGVTYRNLKGSLQPKAPLSLATRRVDHSPVVRQFRTVTRRLAREIL